MKEKKVKLKKNDDAPVLLNDNRGSLKNRFSAFVREYKFLLICALIPAALVYLIYLVRGQHPFGDGTVLVLDLNGQYVFFFKGLRNAVMEGGSLLYSWSRALGGEFMGLYAYYLASPLSYLVCLFPEDRIQEFLLLLLCLKSALCGATMGYYLHKHSDKKHKLSTIAFSILYAMSAYVIVQQNNTMWIDAVIWLPLVAYGVEQVVKYGKYKLYVIALALTVGSNFYIGYMVCIFVFLYYFFYMIAYKDGEGNNPLGEKRHFWKSLVRIGLFSVLAIAIVAVIVLTAYYSLGFGKSDFNTPKWEIEMRFDFFDFLFKLLPSSYDTVRIDGLPFVYCGLLSVILAPLFFCSKKFSSREKIASGAFLLIFVFSFIITPIDLVWHGFSEPQWLNNRYSFMFCFFLVFLAFRAFDAIEEFSAKSLAAVSSFIFLFIVILQQFAPQFEEKLQGLTYGNDDFVVHPFATILLSVIFLVIYISVISAMKHAKNKELVSTVLVVFICLEVFFSGLCNINDLDTDVGYTKYSKYQDYDYIFTKITDTVTDYDDSFYRMEKTYHRKINDNLALGIRGLSNSTSTLNKDTIEFLRSLGYYSQSHKSQYKGGTTVTDSLLGIKYIISNNDYSDIYGAPVLSAKDYAEYTGIPLEELKEISYQNDTYEDYTIEDFNVYLNKYALSLAFPAGDGVLDINMRDHNSYVKEDHEKYNPEGYLNPFDRVNALITAILGENETVEIFKAADQDGNPVVTNATSTVSSQHHKYVGKNGEVTYTYNVPEGVRLYAFFPAYYNRSINLTSDTMDIFEASKKEVSKGIALSKCNDRIVELGVSEDTQYSMTVGITGSNDQYYVKINTSLIYYLDTELLEEVFTTLQSRQLVLDEKYKEDDIRGTMKTEKNDQLVMTTIPYDEGWQVYVDGKKVEICEAAEALVAFRIEDAGEHDVRFVYRSTAFVGGLSISVIGIAAFACIIIFEDKLKKIKLIRILFNVEAPVEK